MASAGDYSGLVLRQYFDPSLNKTAVETAIHERQAQMMADAIARRAEESLLSRMANVGNMEWYKQKVCGYPLPAIEPTRTPVDWIEPKPKTFIDQLRQDVRDWLRGALD